MGNSQSGGLYQYSLCILDSMKNRKDKVIIFNLRDADFPHEKYGRYFRVSNTFKIALLKEFAISIFVRLKPSRDTSTTRNIDGQTAIGKPGTILKGIARLLSWTDALFLRLLLKLNRIDLLIFTAPSHLSYRLIKIPYIMPVHDLQHRLNPQFPEVSADGIWEEREYLYSNAIPNAEAILVDSETGKEDVLQFYPTESNKVKVLPFTPPNYLRGDYTEEELSNIREKYHLPPRFLFYPANFWPHKNHKLIVQALYYIKTYHNLEIPVVFVGSKQVLYSDFDKVWELVTKYNLEDQVYYLGYVVNKDMGCLYRLAQALVMPTFFGPTNIPYLEAFVLGCPVIGSNIRGIREQVSDAGLLINPNSPEDLAVAILKIWNDTGLRQTLAQRGYDKMKSWSFERFSETLNGFIDEIGKRLSSKT